MALAGAAFFATAASAEPTEADLSLGAEVRSFCKIDAPAGDVGEDGAIGLVAETCNMPGVYRVSASFTNLAAGTVRAGTERAAIGDDGVAIFTASGPRRLQRFWALEAARQVDRSQPVRVHLSVMPL
ncbi:hypothetical protein GCM10022281_13200 [Sphingomonas rosea]|uniref:Uncharacterized protein n=2 Tax=Sphingomonas rosea TaxID=335605 RepID=A0ABP7U1H8_9SPHN